jgi:hypothetical protein
MASRLSLLQTSTAPPPCLGPSLLASCLCDGLKKGLVAPPCACGALGVDMRSETVLYLWNEASCLHSAYEGTGKGSKMIQGSTDVVLLGVRVGEV